MAIPGQKRRKTEDRRPKKTEDRRPKKTEDQRPKKEEAGSREPEARSKKKTGDKSWSRRMPLAARQKLAVGSWQLANAASRTPQDKSWQ